jgi:hypothetical protein
VCQPFGTNVIAVCRLPHVKGITGHNRPKLQNAGKTGDRGQGSCSGGLTPVAQHETRQLPFLAGRWLLVLLASLWPRLLRGSAIQKPRDLGYLPTPTTLLGLRGLPAPWVRAWLSKPLLRGRGFRILLILFRNTLAGPRRTQGRGGGLQGCPDSSLADVPVSVSRSSELQEHKKGHGRCGTSGQHRVSSQIPSRHGAKTGTELRGKGGPREKPQIPAPGAPPRVRFCRLTLIGMADFMSRINQPFSAFLP